MKPLWKTDTWAFGCDTGERYYLSRTPFEWQIYIPLAVGRKMQDLLTMDLSYAGGEDLCAIVWEQHVLLSKKVFRTTSPGLAI